MAAISLSNIIKNYDETRVVKGIDLVIEDGEFVVLVGPSGCGKSTTLRMIAGLEQPSSGDIHIGKCRINDVEPQNRNIAMVFQNYALYPHKTVEENIVFALRRLKMSEGEIQQKLEDVSKMLQLEELLQRKPADLSGGQRQRVAMGRAIIRDADCFLFDEPLSNLDAKLRNHMRTEISRIHERFKRTSVYVTHDQVEAMTLADKVVVLRDGLIEQVGTPMEIYLNPVNVFVATFIGSPSMNILDAIMFEDYIELDGYKLPLDKLTQRKSQQVGTQSGTKIKVGIRPDFFNDAVFVSKTEYTVILDNINVQLVEPLGFDKEILFTLAGRELRARLDLRSNTQAGGKIDLAVDLERVLLFSEDGSERL
ncbi:sn-glycerol-3-phosphate ABC transporter ATP-binding protein UgpC [Vibrio cholerae]